MGEHDPPAWGEPVPPGGPGSGASPYPPPGGAYPPPGSDRPPPGGAYPPPGYGYPPAGGSYPLAGSGYPWPAPWQGDRPIGEPTPGSGLAVASLIVGILSLPAILTLVGGVVLGGVALGLGIAAVRRSNRTGAPGRGMAVAGILTGLAGLLLGGVVLAFGIVALTDSNFISCLRQAAGRARAIQRCELHLERHFGS